jgi:hypothetical protein
MKKMWKDNRLTSFRLWILFVVMEEKIESRDEIIQSLKRAFHRQYVPVLTELNAVKEETIDFDQEFDNIVQPLLEKKYLEKEKDSFKITIQGKNHFKRMVRHFRYYDIHLTDAILLEVASKEQEN